MKEKGNDNTADIGTKWPEKEKFWSIMNRLPLRPSSRWLRDGGAVNLLMSLMVAEMLDEADAANVTISRGLATAATQLSRVGNIAIQGFELAKGS